MTKPKVRYDVVRMVEDMADHGLMADELARRAGVSPVTVSRFLRGEIQTAKTCRKLADAMGYSPRRYVIRSSTAREAVSA